MKLIEYIIENKIKIADLKIIKALYGKRMKRGNMDRLIGVHAYVAKESVKKLKAFGILNETVNGYSTNKNNEWVMLLNADPKTLL